MKSISEFCFFFAFALSLVLLTCVVLASDPPNVRENQIAAYLEKQPTSASDRETALERQKRRRVIARSVVSVSKEVAAEKKWLTERLAIAILMTVWWHESHYSQTVHEGGLSRWGSDDGKSKCLGQVQVSAHLTKEQWEATVGTSLEATKRCARATLRRFRSAAWACGRFDGSEQSWRLAFRNYGTGGCEKALGSETARALRAMAWMRAL